MYTRIELEHGFLMLQNSYASIGSFGRKDPLFYSKEQDAAFLNNFEDKVKIEFDAGEYIAVFESRRTSGAKERTIFSYRSPYRISQALNVTELKMQNPVERNDTGASHSTDLDEKVGFNYQRLYAYYDEYRKSNKLTDDQAIEQLLSQLNSIIKKCLDLEISDIGNIVAGRGKLYFKKTDQTTLLDYNILSSGEKEVVDIILDIFLKRDTFDDSVYIIDEPELHLNTDIQRKLLIEIEKMIPDNCQIWVATHSIGFLRALQSELKDKAQVLDFSEQDYFSGTKEILPIKSTRKNWQRIFQTALEDLTGLLSPEKIIYCEGTTNPSSAREERGLDALVYNQIFEEEFHNVLFVSSGGTDVASNLSVALAILSKAFDGVNIFQLKDRDNFDETQRGNFLSVDPNNRMLMRRELENYLFDKEILRLHCLKSGNTFDESRYDQIVSDISMQDIKSVDEEISQICGFTGNPRDFKLELAGFISPDTSVYTELKGCIFQ